MVLLDIILSNGTLIFIGIVFVIYIIVLYTEKKTLKKEKTDYYQKFTSLEQQIKINNTQHENEIYQIRNSFSANLREQELTHLKKDAEQKVVHQTWAIGELEKFKQIELLKIKKELEEQSLKAANVLLQKWKIENEAKIRQDAISRSYSVNLGKITEHLVPFHEVFLSQFNPKDARFIGSPIDLLVFDGYADKNDDIVIYFVEIKSGNSRLTETQKRIKRCVEKGEVRWAEINPDNLKTIAISTNNLETFNNQLELYNHSLPQEIRKALNEIDVSEKIYSNTIDKIKDVINQGFSKMDAIEKIVGSVKFKNESYNRILYDTILKTLN